MEGCMKLRLMLVTGLLATALNSFAGQAKVSPDLQKFFTGPTADVIIQFRTPPSPALISLVKAYGAAFKVQFTSVNAISATLPASAVDMLAKVPYIRVI